MRSLRLVSSRSVPLHASDPLIYNELENPPYVGSSTELKRAAAGQSYIPNENVPLFLDFMTLPPRQVESPEDRIEAQSLQCHQEIKRYYSATP